MAIGDLLAQISGSGPSNTTSTPAVVQPSNLAPKRKADDDLRGSAQTKMSRPNGASLAANRLRAADPIQRPYNGTAGRSTPSTTTTTTTNNGMPKRIVDPANRVTKPSAPARPTRPAPAAAAVKAPPKKGSFAEIMARGQRAQAVMGQVGKIQHKKVEKAPLTMKKREDIGPTQMIRREENGARTLGRPASTGYTGTAGKAAARSVANGGMPKQSPRNDSRPNPAAISKTAGVKKSPAPEPEKKIKKAALATTGYTGTSRATPANNNKRPNPSRGGGGLLDYQPPRPKSSRHSGYQEDEYDEELDDFIEYDDDDDDQGGPRYDYASDASSDMEAGMDELDVEERRAERIARFEDVEEERLERSLKAAKEDRKRKALEQLRAGKRR